MEIKIGKSKPILRFKKGDKNSIRISDNKIEVIYEKPLKGIALAKTIYRIFKEIDSFYSPVYDKFILYGAMLSDYKYYLKKEDKPSNKVLYLNKYDEKDLIYIKSEIYAREIANSPSNIATPEWMVDKAKELAKQEGLEIEILDRKDMRNLGMNLFLAVNQGSDKGAYLVRLTYKGSDKSIALLGKGLCFDTGGLSIKPAKNMYTMNMDKSGAAVVLGVMKAIAALKPKVTVHGFLALTENSVDSKSIQPGAIVKGYNGKYVEIAHTDAEGRLVLADSIAYIEDKYKPNLTITIATLTGAANIVVGRYATPILGNDQNAIKRIIKMGEKEYERLWQLPLYPEYNELLKSNYADLRNIGGWEGEAGTIVGAKFIENFVNGKWVHLDIASTMIDHDFTESARAPNTRTLIRFINEYKI